MKSLTDTIGWVGAIITVVVLVAVLGFLNIWALNTLFPSLNIPFNFETWFASAIFFSNFRFKGTK